LLESTKRNDPEALTQLAMAYATGRGIERDPAEAIRLLERAAGSGYAPAQTNLGYLYANGEAGEVDFGQARKWFEAAADQGDPRALLNLGTLYLYGSGVERDAVRALKLLAQARKLSEDGVADTVLQSVEGSLELLPRNEVVATMQALLTERGYQPGPIDGQFGSRSRSALMRFEEDAGRTPTGEPAAEVLLELAASD